MDLLIQIAQLILALTILVFIHELGHFLAARAFGIRVEKFYIFFDAWEKKLYSFKRGHTEYGIGWLPLGGYVKIAGMIDESLDKEQLNRPAEPWEFRSKPNWQKFIVMIAGITMNIILGIVVFIVYLNHFEKYYISVDSVNNNGGIYAAEAGRNYGFQTGDELLSVKGKHYNRYNDYESQRVYFGADVKVHRPSENKDITIDVPGDAFKNIIEGKPLFDIRDQVIIDSLSTCDTCVQNALKAGLLEGDTITAINGDPIVCFTQLSEVLDNHKGGTVDISVKRKDSTATFAVNVSDRGKIGFIPDFKFFPYDTVRYTFGRSISYGSRDAFEIFYFQAIGLWKIVSGQIKATESVQSPIGITKYFPPKWNWAVFWRMTALISMVLAFMNLLPIPALDGGHIMFIAIESITGKKLSEKFLERAQIVGMVILLSIMIFAVGNDILKLL